ncbi:hypothetical protein PR048_005610 [Dryococelus australis]|uniref:Uncharacterized protein n=1 Tax=Dryococelus australis TaxID=614101 RepID=A0ABQ9I8Q2_9NEOP|nr:hypothetical protein PR048_005610 [Dryococelus australis]
MVSQEEARVGEEEDFLGSENNGANEEVEVNVSNVVASPPGSSLGNGSGLENTNGETRRTEAPGISEQLSLLIKLATEQRAESQEFQEKFDKHLSDFNNLKLTINNMQSKLDSNTKVASKLKIALNVKSTEVREECVTNASQGVNKSVELPNVFSSGRIPQQDHDLSTTTDENSDSCMDAGSTPQKAVTNDAGCNVGVVQPCMGARAQSYVYKQGQKTGLLGVLSVIGCQVLNQNYWKFISNLLGNALSEFRLGGVWMSLEKQSISCDHCELNVRYEGVISDWNMCCELQAAVRWLRRDLSCLLKPPPRWCCYVKDKEEGHVVSDVWCHTMHVENCTLLPSCQHLRRRESREGAECVECSGLSRTADKGRESSVGVAWAGGSEEEVEEWPAAINTPWLLPPAATLLEARPSQAIRVKGASPRCEHKVILAIETPPLGRGGRRLLAYPQVHVLIDVTSWNTVLPALNYTPIALSSQGCIDGLRVNKPLVGSLLVLSISPSLLDNNTGPLLPWLLLDDNSCSCHDNALRDSELLCHTSHNPIFQLPNDSTSSKIIQMVLWDSLFAIADIRQQPNVQPDIHCAIASTIILIDFTIFPRRFAKTQSFGFSLMDVGVGGFIFTNAIVAPEAHRCSTDAPFRAIWKAILTQKRSMPSLLGTNTTHEFHGEFKGSFSDSSLEAGSSLKRRKIEQGSLPCFVNSDNISLEQGNISNKEEVTNGTRHTRIEYDADQSLIEKKKEYNIPIQYSHNWMQLVRSTGKKT